MKVYKLTVMVLDHDEVGDGISSVIENTRYPNRCISPTVVEVESREIGPWNDGNPLNQLSAWREEFRRLFFQGGTP